jgi:uncharacterized protein DUF2782
MTPARIAFASVAVLFAMSAVVPAQTPAPPPPPASTAPPPLPPDASDPDLEPQVTIIRREGEVVEEVRIKGELRFVKVTPTHGRPYYLIPDANGNQFIRRDSLDISLKVPMWVLFSF